MGATTAPTKPTPTDSGTISSGMWATALLEKLNVPTTPANVENIQRWIEVESAGNQAGFMRDNNPLNLNTYARAHGSLPGGNIVQEFGIYVQTFPTVEAGIAATANQISQSPSLVKVLEHSGSPALFGGALSTSAWSSGHYANAATFPTITPFTGNATILDYTPAELKVLAAYEASLKAVGDYDPAQPVLAKLSGVDALVGDITDPTKLKNVGIFVLGLGLAGVGLLIFFSQTKTAKGAEGVAEKVV